MFQKTSERAISEPIGYRDPYRYELYATVAAKSSQALLGALLALKKLLLAN
ncbi:hypothetical protein IQ255_22825 [Pleurocapsales cyanobacterium LEGE 10410]|nr:hypothetical protein [Pleurocapsales cyanobacterium LEGE 10410]